MGVIVLDALVPESAGRNSRGVYTDHMTKKPLGWVATHCAKLHWYVECLSCDYGSGLAVKIEQMVYLLKTLSDVLVRRLEKYSETWMQHNVEMRGERGPPRGQGENFLFAPWTLGSPVQEFKDGEETVQYRRRKWVLHSQAAASVQVNHQGWHSGVYNKLVQRPLILLSPEVLGHTRETHTSNKHLSEEKGKSKESDGRKIGEWDRFVVAIEEDEIIINPALPDEESSCSKILLPFHLDCPSPRFQHCLPLRRNMTGWNTLNDSGKASWIIFFFKLFRRRRVAAQFRHSSVIYETPFSRKIKFICSAF